MFRLPPNLFLLLALLPGVPLLAAPFTPGDLVIYRVGDGTQILANTGNSVFLDEYSPTGTLVQSIPMPTTTSGTSNALISSGLGTSEGLLNLSPDGQFLTLTGYRSTPGAVKLNSSSATTVPRVVGIVSGDAVPNTSTALTDFATANNPRSAVTTDGTHVYVAGGAGGVRYATIGGSTSVQLSTSFTNVRDVDVFGGQLYVSSNVAGLRLGKVGVGTPTISGQTITNLNGVPSSGSGDSYDQYFFADLSPSVAGVDTLYVANEGNGTTNAGGILKYGLIGGLWTLQGTIVGLAADPFHGLTGVVNNGVVTLFATTVGKGDTVGGGHLYKITDNTGQSGTLTGTPTLLATAGAQENFRGVAFAPIPEPSVLPMLLGSAALLAGWTRRRKLL